MKALKTFAPVLLTAVLVFLPLAGLAAGVSEPYGSGVSEPYGSGVSNPSSGGVSNPSTFNSAQYSIQNPLKVNSFCKLVQVILQAIMVIGLPIAVIFLVYVGFKFILAQGNPTAIGNAQKDLFNTVIGIAIFLGAWTIAQVIANTMAQLGVTGFGAC